MEVNYIEHYKIDRMISEYKICTIDGVILVYVVELWYDITSILKVG